MDPYPRKPNTGITIQSERNCTSFHQKSSKNSNVQYNHQKTNGHRKLINLRGRNNWSHRFWGWLEIPYKLHGWKIKPDQLWGWNQFHQKPKYQQKHSTTPKKWRHCKFHWKINWYCTTPTSIANSEHIHIIWQQHCQSHSRCNSIPKKNTNKCCNPSWNWICTKR